MARGNLSNDVQHERTRVNVFFSILTESRDNIYQVTINVSNSINDYNQDEPNSVIHA